MTDKNNQTIPEIKVVTLERWNFLLDLIEEKIVNKEMRTKKRSMNFGGLLTMPKNYFIQFLNGDTLSYLRRL